MKTPSTSRLARPASLAGFALLALVTFGLAAPSPARVPGGLQGRWKLDEGTGTSAADSSGNGNTGTLTNGPAWVAGQAGQALSFDGVDDYVSCGTTGMPAANASQTISWWMNYASVPSAVQCAVGLTNDGSSSSVQVGFRDSKVTVWKFGGTALLSATAPSSAAWHHYAYAFDGTTHGLYIDGTLIITSTVAPQTAVPNKVELGRWSGGSEYFSGKLDEVRVYSRAVTSAEVVGLAHGGALEAWYPLDEGSGTLAADTSGGDFDGTLTNGPTWVAGKVGQALQFDGVNDYVNLGTGLKTLRNVKAATLACWVNMDTGFGDSGGVSFSVGPPPGASALSRAALEILASGAIRAVGRASDTESGQVLDTAAGQVVAGTWTHIACVIRYDTGSLKIYKNGTEVASGTVSFAQTSTADTDSKNAALGSQDDGSGGFHKGKMDEVRVYSRVLTADEIAGLAGGTGTGLAAVYYDNIDYTGTFLQRTDEIVFFIWGTGSPDPSIGADTFSVVWTGQVQPQYTETYTFFTLTDDGVRLWVDGKLVIDYPQDMPATLLSGRKLALEGGKKYDVRMEYYENQIDAVAALGWASPSTPLAAIPKSQLYPTDSTLPVFQTATAQSSDLTKVYLRFSEKMDKTSAETVGNYTVSGGITVNSAALSSDKRVATLTLASNVTLGTTTVTASASILGITREAIAQTTRTVVAGSAQGLPDSTAVALSLSTDSNQKTILWNEQQKITLTVTAPGTSATTVDLSQIKRFQNGRSWVKFDDAGENLAWELATSGGMPNQATVRLRGQDFGTFKDDADLVARVAGEERGISSFTVVKLDFTPTCAYSSDQRAVRQEVQTTPVIPNLQLLTSSRILLGGLAGGTAGPMLSAPQFPAADSVGKATRQYASAENDAYIINTDLLQTTNTQDNANGKTTTDHSSDGPHENKCEPDCPPGEKTKYTYPCQSGSSKDSGEKKSVDVSNGEKKVHATDLFIRGRGLGYQFGRAYLSHDYRGHLVSRGDFGRNWTFTYADDFILQDGSDSTAPIIQFEDMQANMAYIFRGTVNAWQPSRELSTHIRKNTNPQPDVFELRDQHGTVKTYHDFSGTGTPNLNGRLKEIRDRNDNFMTFLYDQIDPNGTASSGDEKFVLTRVVDTLGREIRYQYYAATVQSSGGRTLTVLETGAGARGRLARVIDFKGNMQFDGPTEPDFPGQTVNRTLVFDYDSEGNLVRCSGPAVTGTPQGNDFTVGKTTRYKYIVEDDLSGLVSNWGSLTAAQKDVVRGRLLHKMTRIWYPNEVRNTVGTNPPDADAAEVVTYDTTATFDPSTSTFLALGNFLGFAKTYTIGGQNPVGVPSGGTITYTYTDLNPSRSMPGGVSADYTLLLNVQSLKVAATDRNGNQADYIWGGGRNLQEYHEKTSGFRTVEPAEFLLTLQHQKDEYLKKQTLQEGNLREFTFNENSTDRFQKGNLIRQVRTPDAARGGDQPKIEAVLVYEPIYNRPCLMVQARGSNSGANGFTPPIADPASRTMTDPYDATKTLNLRYAKVEFFDFQEATEKASQAPASRKDIDGSGGQVNQSPLISVDPNVLTTEVWLVQELGLSEDSAGLTELRARLSNNLTKLGLGDLNGDADITPAVAGNIVRTVFGSPVLLTNTNQHALETAIDPIDLIDQTKPYDQGGTLEGSQGARLQTIVWMYQYNKFGQRIQTISPEGNVTTHEYFAENNPDGDTIMTPTPADGRTLGTQDSAADRTNGGGGYVHFTVVDRTRTDSYVKFFDQAGTNRATATFHNNNTGPTATNIKTCACIYDDVGNLVQRHDPRGIRMDSFVNELDQVVEVIGAADITEASSADPSDPLVGATIGPLTAFAYKNRTYFDYNGNVVLTQREDRGNTSSVDGNGLKQKDLNGTLTSVPIPQHVADTTPGLTVADGGDPSGGIAFVDGLRLYDRLNNLIESRVEVDSTRMLQTRYRFDANQNQVLVIYPEGNADGSVYDERDLLFQGTRGTSSRPTAGKYASGDPTTFDRPGGSGTQPSTFTYNYDKNQNLLETVDALSHGGTGSSIAGSGDATKRTYDGYDRPKTVTDPLGNKAIYVYDPDSNVVRVILDGDPIDDIAGASENKTLSVIERIHDELSRTYVTHQVLFQTPDVVPSRTPTLTDTSSMDTLAAYLADASSDTASVPGATGITVIGRVTSIREYDRESRVTFSIEDDLDVYRTDYDGATRTIKSSDSALSNGFSAGAFNPGNLSGNLVETAYDDNSNAIEVKETDVTTVGNVANEFFRTTVLYDSLDRLQTRVDNLGQTADFRSDSRSHSVATADAVGPVTTRTINRRGLGSTAAVTVNNFGNVVRRTFDGISRLLETETRLTASGQGDGTNIGATLEGVKTTAPTVDTAQSGDGLISVYHAYDDNSQMLAVRDDNGNTTVYIYDNQNRTLKERKGLGLTGTSFTITGGDTGAFNVALRGGVTPVDTEASGTDITLTYDKDSNVTTRLDEAGNSRDCTYDALNRRKTCSITAAAGFTGTRGTNAQTWKFDGLSRKSECTDVNEPTPTTDDVLCTFFYDSLSRKVEETQKIGSLSAKALSCSYDIAASGAEGQPSMCTYPDGRKVHSRYDTLDRLVRRFDDDGTTQYSDIGKYEYIGRGRVAVLTYQNNIRLTHIGQVSSQNADVGFDGLRRIVNHRWESFTTQALGSGTVVVGFEHRDGNSTPAPLYDRANNKRIEYKTHDPENSEQYKYDAVYRLTSTGSGSQGQDARGFERGTFTSTARSSMAGSVGFFQDWDLEGLGNWSREDDNARIETRTHSDFNEIVDRVVSSQTATLTHDKTGNVTDTGYTSLGGQNFPGGGLRLEWDALNRLRKVFKNNNTPGNTADDVLVGEYTYDCENRRLRKVVTNSGSLNGTTDFYYEGWRNLEERDAADAVTNQYTYGNYLDEVWTLDNRRGGAPISFLNDNAGVYRHFYLSNTLYHVYGLTNEGSVVTPGTLKEAYEYDAYGRQTVITDGNDPDTIVNFNANDVRTVGGASTINASPYQYTGQRFDAESGLMYFKNRYQSPELGRFLSRDAAVGSGLRPYEYAGSKTTRNVDGFGLAACQSDSGDCCCCVRSVELESWNDYRPHDPSGEGRFYGTDFYVRIYVEYVPAIHGNLGGDCVLHWYEHSNDPIGALTVPPFNLTPNNWFDLYKLGVRSKTFDPWNARPKFCGTSYSVTLHDEPGIGPNPLAVDRFLSIAVEADSAPECWYECGTYKPDGVYVTQTISIEADAIEHVGFEESNRTSPPFNRLPPR